MSLSNPLDLKSSRNSGNDVCRIWLSNGLAGVEVTHGGMGLLGGDEPPILWDFERYSGDSGYAYRFEMNFLVLLLACGDWPLNLLGRYVRARLDRKKGFCRCGYDLTGNISGICPECGTPVSGLPPKVE